MTASRSDSACALTVALGLLAMGPAGRASAGPAAPEVPEPLTLESLEKGLGFLDCDQNLTIQEMPRKERVTPEAADSYGEDGDSGRPGPNGVDRDLVPVLGTLSLTVRSHSSSPCSNAPI